MLLNPFTNDARVKREARCLIDEGYVVDIIAIKTKDVKSFEVLDGINIIRVEKSGRWIRFLRNKKYKLLLVSLLVVSLFLLLYIKVYLAVLLLIGITLIRKWLINLMMFIRVVIKMSKIGLKNRYDIYHAHDLNTLIQVVICAKMRRKKCIYDSHEVQTSRSGYNRLTTKFLEWFLVHFIDEMIMTTETRANYIEKIYHFKPKVIHNYAEFIDYDEVDSIDYYQTYQISLDKKIILYQGGLQPGRGLTHLVRAMCEVDDGHLVIIGKSYKDEKKHLLEIVDEYNLDHRVTFIDKVPLHELPRYTKGAYMGCQLLQNINFNHYSALSNKLFEYMMMHLPIISCNLIEIRKVVEENKIGLVVNSDHVNEISTAINQLIHDPDLHTRFVSNCRRAKLIYNWDNERHQLIRIYHHLLSK